MEAHTSKTGCRGCHCDLGQHISYVFVYGFHQVLIRSTWCFYFVGALLFCDNLQNDLGALLLGRALLIGTLRYVSRLAQVMVCCLWLVKTNGRSTNCALTSLAKEATTWTNVDLSSKAFYGIHLFKSDHCGQVHIIDSDATPLHGWHSILLNVEITGLMLTTCHTSWKIVINIGLVILSLFTMVLNSLWPSE